MVGLDFGGRARESRTRGAPTPETAGRDVPAAVRAEVWRRDDARRTFVGISGHRCGSTHQLELHARPPYNSLPA